MCTGSAIGSTVMDGPKLVHLSVSLVSTLSDNLSSVKPGEHIDLNCHRRTTGALTPQS